MQHKCDCGTTCPPYCGRCGCESQAGGTAWLVCGAIVAVMLFWILVAKWLVRSLDRQQPKGAA